MNDEAYYRKVCLVGPFLHYLQLSDKDCSSLSGITERETFTKGNFILSLGR